MLHYKALFLSDLHLGSRSSEVGRLMLFLENIKADVLYLVGDITNGRKEDISADAIRAMREVAPKVIYAEGNHDHLGVFGGLVSVSHAIHTTADGKRLLVCHGDRWDPLMDGWWIVFSGLQQNILRRFVYRRFREKARYYAQGQECDGVVCGHIHRPEIINERGFVYANAGDWVTHCSAIVEHDDGRLELCYG